MRFLFVDRIVQMTPGEMIRGVKHVTPDDYYLTSDEQGNPCFIPSLIGETLGQLAAWNAMHTNGFSKRPVAGVAASAQVFRNAYVGDTIFLESVIDNIDDEAIRYHSVARVDDQIIFRLDNALGPLLPMDTFIDKETVKNQFEMIFNLSDEPEWSIKSNHHEKIAPVVKPLSCVSMTFDGIVSHKPGSSIVAEKRVSLAAPYFPDHFPRKPVLPLTVLMECKLNLAKFFVASANFDKHYQLEEIRKVKMKDFVVPGDVVICTLKLKQMDNDGLVLSFISEVKQRRVCTLEVLMVPKGEV